MTDRKYYEAYNERYKTVHSQGIRWFGDKSSAIVGEIISKYGLSQNMKMLEIGCGEGRDAQVLLEKGFQLLATDISPEVISYCQNMFPFYKNNFRVLDCVKDTLDETYDFIYAVAVIHMLVLDEDRDAFYGFMHEHLAQDGIALICSMGDGKIERQSDIKTAFELQERECEGEKILVAGTSCRMVSDESFEKELERNNLKIVERGQTSIPEVFSDMMYVVVKKK